MSRAAGGDADAAKLAVWKQALYEKCKDAAPENDMFSQDDLLRLDVIPNKDLLLLARVVQSLSDDKLFITMREASGQVLWKWRDAQEAHKYVRPTPKRSLAVLEWMLTGLCADISSVQRTSRFWSTLWSTMPAATEYGRRRCKSASTCTTRS